MAPLKPWSVKARCRAMLLEVETVHELEGAWWAFALKAARRASVSALCCAIRRRFSCGVTLVSRRGCRANGLPIDRKSVV